LRTSSGLSETRFELLVGLLDWLSTVLLSAAENSAGSSERGTNQRNRRQASRNRTILRTSRRTGDSAGSRAYCRAANAADRCALHCAFEFVGAPGLARGFTRRKRATRSPALLSAKICSESRSAAHRCRSRLIRRPA